MDEKPSRATKGYRQRQERLRFAKDLKEAIEKKGMECIASHIAEVIGCGERAPYMWLIGGDLPGPKYAKEVWKHFGLSVQSYKVR